MTRARVGPRALWVVGTALLVPGCAGSPRVEQAAGPATIEEDAPRPAQAPVAAPSPADSLADLEALEALRELEYASTSGNGPFDTLEVLRQFDLDPTANVRGGAASRSGPSYDIDVESFATHARVRYYMDFFLGPSRDRFTIWLGRLNRYEGMIRQRFRAMGVPQDLVYLAMIESGYSNTAVSRANAVGMWQFIAPTATRYGLEVTDWVDARRDPFQATDAAARYLAEHREQFGSWYLAAAAYNGGPRRVSRGLERLSGGAVEEATDETFFQLSDRRYLRRETRDYVPKLIAATLIAKDPLRFGFDSIPYLQPLVFDEITVEEATGLDVLAELADTTVAALVELNPHYYRGVTPPDRTSIVRVPRGLGPLVAQRYAALPPEDRVNFVQHQIQKGETLGGIGRRYGVSVRLLLAANPGVEARRLRIGQRLVIPLSPTARTRPQSAPRVLTTGRERYHVVRWGESLWLIARRYGVTVESLRRWNGMQEGDVLHSGRRLIVAPG